MPSKQKTTRQRRRETALFQMSALSVLKIGPLKNLISTRFSGNAQVDNADLENKPMQHRRH
ncbi:MAG TPA: hypothetical protein VJ904_03925, partial [Tichowtungia sp.]|nr:hypothetical protein [Tichowtungia sp.]